MRTKLNDRHDGLSQTHLSFAHRLLAAQLLVALLPLSAAAVCGVGGTSTVRPPAVTSLRSYRASFSVPTRIAADAAGNVYVTDPGHGEIVVRAPNGRVIARTGPLGDPLSVAARSGGGVYVGDASAGNVTAYDQSWQPVLQLGEGPGEFIRPSDIAVDAATGDVYVVDSITDLVKVYDAAGTFLRSFGGHGSGDGLFSYPVSVVVDDSSRQVLVVDQLNYRVQILDLDGNVLACFGGQGSGPGKFNLPQGIALDALGRVYVADSVEGRIQVLDRSGNFISYIGGFGEGLGQLRIPVGMIIDPLNRLYVATANNGRLEMFGLDAFTDPETVVPGVVHLEQNPVDRAAPGAVIAGYVEVPGHPLELISPGSIKVNGVSAAEIAGRGDHDHNGVPDLRFKLDAAALLATFPADGSGTATLTGRIGTSELEASGAVQVTTCAPSTPCPLGDADPQCNDAVCIPPAGCAVQPKANGSGCEDGNACTIDDVCTAGVCNGEALRCNDNDPCTDDICDPLQGCTYVTSATPLECDDGNVCTDDTCAPTIGCIHDNRTGPCDDSDPGTVGDACDASGTCAGRVVSGSYAVLQWPLESYTHRSASVGAGASLRGDVCAEAIRLGLSSRVEGDVVGWAPRWRAVALRRGVQVAGDVVSGGGRLFGVDDAVIGGRADISGQAPELGECLAARHRASRRRGDLLALPSAPGLSFGRIQLQPKAGLRIPAAGELGSGQVVIDAADLRLSATSTLTLVGSPATQAVIVRIRSSMLLGRAARIELEGLSAGQLIFVVDGAAILLPNASLVGSVFAKGRVHLGSGSSVTGALFGAAIDLAPSATVDLHPYAGW